jgi:hypothetical protein
VGNQLSIVGIRSKSTSSKPTYFFSIESEDVDFLRNVKDIVQQTLWVHNIEIKQEKRYHD